MLPPPWVPRLCRLLFRASSIVTTIIHRRSANWYPTPKYAIQVEPSQTSPFLEDWTWPVPGISYIFHILQKNLRHQVLILTNVHQGNITSETRLRTLCKNNSTLWNIYVQKVLTLETMDIMSHNHKMLGNGKMIIGRCSQVCTHLKYLD